MLSSTCESWQHSAQNEPGHVLTRRPHTAKETSSKFTVPIHETSVENRWTMVNSTGTLHEEPWTKNLEEQMNIYEDSEISWFFSWRFLKILEEDWRIKDNQRFFFCFWMFLAFDLEAAALMARARCAARARSSFLEPKPRPMLWPDTATVTWASQWFAVHGSTSPPYSIFISSIYIKLVQISYRMSHTQLIEVIWSHWQPTHELDLWLWRVSTQSRAACGSTCLYLWLRKK